jgi:uncharacterized GH25 family protein
MPTGFTKDKGPFKILVKRKKNWMFFPEQKKIKRQIN